jgi:hypothetical protein
MFRAFMRLNSTVQKTVIVLLILLGGFLIWALSSLMRHPIVDSSGWPTSTLDRVVFGNAPSYKEYEDLPTTIQFPGTLHTIMVGGTAAYTYNDGLSFRYGEDAVIVACMVDANNAKEVIETRFPQYLTGTPVGGKYQSHVHGEGYFNTREAEYEGGILNVNGEEYYVLSYRIKLEDGKVMQIGVVCIEAKYLDSMKSLLDRIAYTYAQVAATSSNQSQTGDTSSLQPVTESANKVVVGNEDPQPLDRTREEVAEIDKEYDSMDREETIQYFNDAQDEAQYALNYPDKDEYLIETVDVSGELSSLSCAFYFTFTHSETVPKECVLTSPSGQKYQPDDNNNTRMGYIVFYVDKPEKGTWEIKLSTNNKYGTYDFSVTDRVSFVNENRAYPPNAELWDSDNKDY